MSKILRAALVVTTVGMAAAASHAQTIGMYGEYHESNGILVNIPQNPPIVACVPPPLLAAPPPHQTIASGMTFQHIDLRPVGVNDARCPTREQHVNFTTMAPGVFNQPEVGNRGARSIAAVGDLGMAVGDPFVIPPFAFGQNLGPQVDFILNSSNGLNAIRQLDTTFIAAMPGIDRIGPNPGPLPTGGSYTVKTSMQLIPAPALTRRFSQMNWQNPGNGQNNGKPGAGFAARLNANTVHLNSVAGGAERVEVRYRSNPRQFGGTMALLLDGKGKFYLRGITGSSGMFPALLKPVAASQPFQAGDNLPGFRVRNAHGWDETAVGFQLPGKVKAFVAGTGGNPANAFTPMGAPRVAVDCIGINPQNPAGCNEVNGFGTFMAGPFTTMTLMIPVGGTIAVLPGATSVKHAFALTTGTVSIVRVGQRGGAHFSDTLTGMGYDTVGLSSRGGLQRNVGLVAGSYAVRTDANGDIQINTQMLGLSLKFIPEPGATIALASALGLLGLFAQRRRACGRPCESDSSL